jgi:hypothetical protein
MIERILKNRKTSVSALLVFMMGGLMVYLEKATLTEFGAFLGVALVLLFSKDPKFTRK